MKIQTARGLVLAWAVCSTLAWLHCHASLEELKAKPPEVKTVTVERIVEKTVYIPPPSVETVSRGLPRATTGEFKSYMDYRAITNRGSDQYALQRFAVTDDAGYRRIGSKYMVAMGTYYAKRVGQCFRITLSSGQYFYAIVGDVKADRHTDKAKQYCLSDKTIIEFIVDTKKISTKSRSLGSMAEFPGAIVGIEEVIDDL